MSLSDLCFAPAVLGILLGWYFGWKAHANVSDVGHQQHLRLWFFRRAEYYTAQGWRYFTLSIIVAISGGLVSMLLELTLC